MVTICDDYTFLDNFSRDGEDYNLGSYNRQLRPVIQAAIITGYVKIARMSCLTMQIQRGSIARLRFFVVVGTKKSLDQPTRSIQNE
jgi:hypothetical protein